MDPAVPPSAPRKSINVCLISVSLNLFFLNEYSTNPLTALTPIRYINRGICFIINNPGASTQVLCSGSYVARSQYLPFALAFASSKAGYAGFLVVSSTYNRKGYIAFLPLLFDIFVYIPSLDFLHTFL